MIYAISLGGDKDTIASMTEAMAGAHCGLSSIRRQWIDRCDGTHGAKRQTDQLHELVVKFPVSAITMPSRELESCVQKTDVNLT